MLRLIANVPHPSVSTPVYLELKQNENDDEVDILMNGSVIAYFAVTTDGKISLQSCLNLDDKKFVETDEKGLIKVS